MKIEIECKALEFEYLVRAIQVAAAEAREKAKFLPGWNGVAHYAHEWELAFNEGATFPADYDGPKVEIIREGQ